MNINENCHFTHNAGTAGAWFRRSYYNSEIVFLDETALSIETQ